MGRHKKDKPKQLNLFQLFEDKSDEKRALEKDMIKRGISANQSENFEHSKDDGF